MTVRVVSAPWVLPGRSAAPLTARTAGGEGIISASAGGMGSGAIRDAALALDGDTIVAVGPRAEVEARHGPGDPLDAVVLPALVNAHLHLELSHMAGMVTGGDGLPSWIELFIAARRHTIEGAPEQAMTMGAEDLVRAGVAAVGDVTNTLGSLRPLAAAGICGTLYLEVFGLTPGRIETALEAAHAARDAAGEPPPGLRIALSPHAVYSTHGPTLAALLRAGPASIHLAEDPAERELCARGTGEFARLLRSFGEPVERLRPSGRSALEFVAPHLAPHHLAVHCVDLDDEDVALLARSGATVVLCPRSNRSIVGALAPVRKLLAAGIPLAVGTDSLASSPSLAPLAELALLRDALPDVPATRLLPLAWNGPAVGAPAVGQLAPGAAPGVIAAPLGGVRVEDPFEFLVSTFGREERPFTWIARHRPAAPVTPTTSADAS